MKPKFKIGQKVKVKIGKETEAVEFGVVKGISTHARAQYRINDRWYNDTEYDTIYECTEQEISDYFVN